MTKFIFLYINEIQIYLQHLSNCFRIYIIIFFYRNMQQSSFLSNSSKYKKRKPIFAKNQSSPVTKLDEHLSRSTSQHPLTNRISTNSPLHINSRVLTRPVESRVQVQRVEVPSNSTLRISFSQPKVVPVSNQQIIFNAHPTPALTRSITPQKIIYQHPLQTTQYQPQSSFYQTMQPSTLRRSSHHLYQTQPINMVKVQRKSRIASNENCEDNGNSGLTLKPTVVAIERVMKQVGSNHIQKEITYLSKEDGQCEPPTVRVTPPPSEFTASATISPACYTPSNFTVDLTPSRIRACSEDVEISKLSQINSLLTQNYNLLYNQFFNLKREIREEEVVEEQAFLHRSVNQIQSIFNVQTSQALSQIQQVFQSSKQPLKKSFKNRNQIKIKNVYV